MLRFDHVSAGYGRKTVLRDISFQLRPNRLTVLVGPNGSGKSTILACVNQQLRYTGEITVAGQPLEALSPRQRAKQVAILPQTLPMPHITGWELAALGRNPYVDITGKLRAEDRKAVNAALSLVAAEAFADRYVDSLSGGEAQRCALAMVLAQTTPLVLLDEPTAYMDIAHAGAFLSTVHRLTGEQGKTILMTLHDLNLAVEYADDLLVLSEGKLVFSGTKEECLQTDVLEHTFSMKRYRATDGAAEKTFFTPR